MISEQTRQTNRYPDYKDSGVDWLGEIPAHWEVNSLRSLIELKSNKNRPELQVLSVYRDYGVIPKDSRDDNHNATSLDTSTYKAVEPGYLVVNKMKAWQGSMGISAHEGIVSPAYITCKVTSSKIVSPFLHQLLRCDNYIGEYNRLSYGVRVGQWDMHFEDFKRVCVVLPSLAEQTRIAEFLDQKTAQIDQAIAQKERLIELLNERRQVMIHRAVTRGLNPNAPMKDSGIEWIGEIPEHWEVSKLGYLTSKIGDGLHGTPNYVDNSEYFFINGNNLNNGTIKITDQTKQVSKKEYLLNKKVLTNRTLLLSINGTIGNLAFYRNEKVILGKSSAYINFLKGPNLNFMFHYLGSRAATTFFDRELSGSTINNLSLHSISKLPICMPPPDEQDLLFTWLQSLTDKTNEILISQEAQIQKLQELKSTLINSAVTGKIKV